MYEVVVKHKAHLSFSDKAGILNEVATIIAQELDCDDPDGRLTAEDIKMFFERMDRGDKCDHNLYFKVEASTYPSRKRNIADRTNRITDRLRKIYGDQSVGLCVRLSDGHSSQAESARRFRSADGH